MTPRNEALLLIWVYVYFLFGGVQTTTNCSQFAKILVVYKKQLVSEPHELFFLIFKLYTLQ